MTAFFEIAGDWVKHIVNCAQMKAIDAATIQEMGVPSCVLMERAALAVVEEIKLRALKNEKILVVCGSGNNGGDGIAIARILCLQGFHAEIYLAGKIEKMTEETALQYKIAKNYGVPFVNNLQWHEYTVIVDAIFGVGLTREIQGSYRDLILEMNQVNAYKVAVDLPSGIDGDDGKILGVAFGADVTVTFAYRKRGLCFYPGRMYAGKIITADIGIYTKQDVPQKMQIRDLTESKKSPLYTDGYVQCIEKQDLEKLPVRAPFGNKGTFGKVLVVAGSEGMCGASYFAASAALAGGCGMVKIVTAEENRIPLQTMLPEAMIFCDFSEEENKKNLNWCDVLVIGPGIGTSKVAAEHSEWFLKHAKEAEKSVVLDADGLNLLASNPDWQEILPSNLVLTPHVGEMSRLCGKTIAEIQKSLIETALACAKKYKAVCVLKDACTVIADTQGDVFLNLSGNAGMATAGSGDVLAGLLGALLCMEWTEETGFAAALGVWIHGAAGDLAAEKVGMHSLKARDIIENINGVLQGKEGK